MLEPRAAEKGIPLVTIGYDVAIAVELPAGEEKAGVVRSLVDDLAVIAGVLEALPPKPVASSGQESDDEVFL